MAAQIRQNHAIVVRQPFGYRIPNVMINRERVQQNEVRTFAQDLVEDVRIATADLHT
jgi:hypothetical protein